MAEVKLLVRVPMTAGDNGFVIAQPMSMNQHTLLVGHRSDANYSAQRMAFASREQSPRLWRTLAAEVGEQLTAAERASSKQQHASSTKIASIVASLANKPARICTVYLHRSVLEN